MAEGNVHYIVEEVQTGGGREPIPWVTPIAQATDMVRARVERQTREQPSVLKKRRIVLKAAKKKPKPVYTM